MKPACVRTVVALYSVVLVLSMGLVSAADPVTAVKNGFGVKKADLEKLAVKGVPFVDFHVHLRGGMTVEKAVERQKKTGIRIGVLRNIGTGWPIDMSRCYEAIEKYGLSQKDLYVPAKR